jgi:hypothetical protein
MGRRTTALNIAFNLLFIVITLIWFGIVLMGRQPIQTGPITEMTFFDQTTGIEIKYPSNWYKGMVSGNGILFLNSPDGNAVVLISKESDTLGLTNNDFVGFVDNNKGYLISNFVESGVRDITYEKRSFAGLDTVYSMYSLIVGGQNIKCLQYGFIGGKNTDLITVRYYSIEEHFEDNLDEAMKIINTTRLTST